MSTQHTDISDTLSIEYLRSTFSGHGLRTTRQREAVYQVLCAGRSHPTADELMALVRSIDPDVSQATIYNTLEALVECGLANRIPSPESGGACKYDANTDEHVHLVLEDGRVVDVPMDLSRKIIESVPRSILDELSGRMGIGISTIKIELTGQSLNA